MEDKRAEQHLAAGVLGALLFAQPGLERFPCASSWASRSSMVLRGMEISDQLKALARLWMPSSR